MSNKLLLASLAALIASTAFAAPSDPVAPPGAKPVPAPLPTCTAGGDAVFTIDHKSDVKDLARWKFTLLSKGMYTLTTVRDGKSITASGCAGTPNVSRILTAFSGVPWKVGSTGPACAAYSAQYVEYTVGGRLVYTERMCNGAALDAASSKALATALAIVKPFDVMPATPPSSVSRP